MKNPELYVGQELILVGGLCRRGPTPVQTVVICKIGREYFYVASNINQSQHMWLKFRKSDWSWTGDQNWSYKLYETIEDYRTRRILYYRQTQLETFFRQSRYSHKVDDQTINTIYELMVQKGYIKDEPPVIELNN